jgi:ATP-binding cassette, subfamily B, bacterial
MSPSRPFARQAPGTTGNGSRRVLHRAGQRAGESTALRSRRSGIYLRLLRDARPYAPRIGALTFLSLLATPLALLLPVPLKIAVDSVVGSQPPPAILEALLPAAATHSDTALLITVGVMFVAIAFLSQLVELARLILGTHTGERLLILFRCTLFLHVQRLSLSYHDRRAVGDSAYRIQWDASNLRDLVEALFPLIAGLSMFAGILYVTVQINWQLALVAFAVAPVLIAVAKIYGRRLRSHWHAAETFESRGLSVVQETLSALRVVNAFGQEQREASRFVDRAWDGSRARLRLASVQGGLALLVGLTTAVGTAVVLFVGVSQVKSGAITLGELLMVMAYLTLLYQPLEDMGKRVADLQSAFAGLERAYSLLDEVPEVQERPNARPLRRATGAVGFRDVSFGYQPGVPVLENVSFRLEPGSFVGVSGATGAGKTTLVSLLTRFYDPDAGQIALDGVDLRDYRLRDLRNQFAIVLQEPVLFSTTIAENIAYGRPGAGEDAIVEAAKGANAHEFIAALPEGYETQVGERGMLLSGGERQRVSLARAFLKDASILILDEPTSAVDFATEEAIIDAIGRLAEGRTALLITHRPNVQLRCERVLRVDKGRVVESEPARAQRPPTKKRSLLERALRVSKGLDAGSTPIASNPLVSKERGISSPAEPASGS